MGKKARIKAQRAASDEECRWLLTNNKVRDALNEEIQRVLDKQVDFIAEANVAAVMYTLHEEFGFGKKRLLRWSKKFNKYIDDLRKAYQMFDKDSDIEFLCMRELKKLGIDVHEIAESKGE